jgi:hypothetical protein
MFPKKGHDLRPTKLGLLRSYRLPFTRPRTWSVSCAHQSNPLPKALSLLFVRTGAHYGPLIFPLKPCFNFRPQGVAARRFDETIPVLKKAYAKFQATCEPNSVQIICARAELGRCLLENGQPHEALPYLKVMYERSLANSGPAHSFVVIDRNDLARCYEACAMFAEAIPHRRELRDHFCKTGDTNSASRQAKLLEQDLAGLSM